MRETEWGARRSFYNTKDGKKETQEEQSNITLSSKAEIGEKWVLYLGNFQYGWVMTHLILQQSPDEDIKMDKQD